MPLNDATTKQIESIKLKPNEINDERLSEILKCREADETKDRRLVQLSMV